MSKPLSRREFIKLSGAGAATLPFYFGVPEQTPDPNAPNFLVIVFDALTARNMSLYGYQRDTTPNLARLAERAIVYYNHHAGGGYTTPGTATLLTGTLPWTHRAMAPNSEILPRFEKRNIFSAFSKANYYRIAFTHNGWADIFLNQFKSDLERHVPLLRLFLNDQWINQLFPNDLDAAMLAVWRGFGGDEATAATNNLYISKLRDIFVHPYRRAQLESYQEEFPRGLTAVDNNYFLMADAQQELLRQVNLAAHPYIGYFHFFPPHHPYRPSKSFIDIFKDGWQPDNKPRGRFHMSITDEDLQVERRKYDEFVAYVDDQFNQLYQNLADSGALENTWIVLTADHGEVFEKGIKQHLHFTLYEPQLHIPLMIFPPGQTERINIYNRTSAVDILPTLSHLGNQELPDWSDGQVLPPFNHGSADPNRPIYAIDAKEATRRDPINQSTLVVYRNNYKLIYFSGYKDMAPGEVHLELYDLENDPEELNDLFTPGLPLAQEMLVDLLKAKNRADQPFN